VKHPLSPEAFQSHFLVSSETMIRLNSYVQLLRRWQRRINLVGPRTLEDPWRRHVLDSAQLVPLLPPGTPDVVDLGSGAGFPGLVLAILSSARVVLVESDARKCAFLAQAARATGSQVRIANQRIESLDDGVADVVTARACAPLTKLLGLSQPIVRQKGICLFLKGRMARTELTDAEKSWKITASFVPSQSDPSGEIIQVQNFGPRDDS